MKFCSLVERYMISLERKEMNRMKRPVSVAVLGAGYWGRKVMSEYMRLGVECSSMRLAAVCDLKEENLQFANERLGVDKDLLSTEYNEVLSRADIDAVHICTPNETHYQFCKEALAAGKHVLLEKPMALCARDAWELVGLAEFKHLCLQVGHIYRFNNAIKKIRELSTMNYFGQLYYLKLQWTTWMPSPLGRDIIFDLGPHPVDIVNFLLGKWPSRVSCTARAYRRKLLEEVAYLTMQFDDEVMAHVELSWLQPGKVRELNVMGSERSAIVDCLNQTVRIYEDNNGHNFSLDVIKNNTILDEVCHFINSILEKNNHGNPGAIGAGNVAVLESLKKSISEDKAV